MKKPHTLWKWLLSYRKTKWEFSDYPVQIVKQVGSDPEVPAYRALIKEWLLMGFGDTKEAATENLKENFEKFLVNCPQDVTRPGVMKPLDSFFAPHERVDEYFETAKKFGELVLGFEPDAPFFFSDESSLSDFEDSEKDPIDYLAKTKEVFGVDISDIEGGNLLLIFERIDESSR